MPGIEILNHDSDTPNTKEYKIAIGNRKIDFHGQSRTMARNRAIIFVEDMLKRPTQDKISSHSSSKFLIFP